MWELVPRVDTLPRAVLLPGMSCLVGRKDAHLALSADRSVSRRHALLQADAQARDAQGRACVVLTDESTLGTSVAGQRVKQRVAVSVNEGDQVQFGLADCVYRLCWRPLRIVASKLGRSERQTVRSTIKHLGETLDTAVTAETTHVLMPVGTPTAKMLQALILAVPIVTPAWLAAVAAHTDPAAPLPMPSLFPPALDATPLPQHQLERLSLAPNSVRRTLFQDRRFLAVDPATHERAADLIALAGGKVIRLPDTLGVTDEEEDAALSAFLKQHQATVLLAPLLLPPEDLRAARVVLAAHRLSFVVHDESSVIHALLLASTTEYCNPACRSDHLVSSHRRLVRQAKRILGAAGASQASAASQLATMDPAVASIPPVLDDQPAVIVKRHPGSDQVAATNEPVSASAAASDRKVDVKSEPDRKVDVKSEPDRKVDVKSEPDRKVVVTAELGLHDEATGVGRKRKLPASVQQDPAPSRKARRSTAPESAVRPSGDTTAAVSTTTTTTAAAAISTTTAATTTAAADSSVEKDHHGGVGGDNLDIDDDDDEAMFLRRAVKRSRPSRHAAPPCAATAAIPTSAAASSDTVASGKPSTTDESAGDVACTAEPAAPAAPATSAWTSTQRTQVHGVSAPEHRRHGDVESGPELGKAQVATTSMLVRPYTADTSASRNGTHCSSGSRSKMGVNFKAFRRKGRTGRTQRNVIECVPSVRVSAEAALWRAEAQRQDEDERVANALFGTSELPRPRNGTVRAARRRAK